MLTFKEAWEDEVEQQRKDYYNRVGDHSYSGPPLRFNTRPPTIPSPVAYTQAWSDTGRHLERSMRNSSSRTAVKATQVRSQEKSYLQTSSWTVQILMFYGTTRNRRTISRIIGLSRLVACNKLDNKF